jgi:hypothetical protein
MALLAKMRKPEAVVERAFDVNEVAWDPSRDSGNERLSLLRELDATSLSHPSQILDPLFRTVGGEPLGPRRAALLLGCTFNDLEALVNRINVSAEYDDDDELSDLTRAIEELEQLLGRHRVLRRDSDDRTLERMNVDDRRQARRLQVRVDQLRLQRYDPVTVKRRDLTGLLPYLARLLTRAADEGQEVEVARLESLIETARTELDALTP